MNRLRYRAKVVSQIASYKPQGAPEWSSAPLLTSRLPLTAHRLLLRRHQLGQPALLPSGGILMNDALAARAVEELHRLVIRSRGLGTSGTAHLLERGAELAPMGPIENGAGTGLAHALGGGLDSGHGYLGERLSRSGAAPEAEPENIGYRACKVKQEAALTWFPAAFNLRRPRAKDGRLEQLSNFVLALPMLVFAMVAHEYAHAVTALRQGDDTAYMLGRVTLNPLPHIDPWMSIAMPALIWFATNGAYTFGGAKPVPVNPRKFRNYVKGDLLVSAAGVATNLMLSLVCAVVFILLGLAAGLLPQALPVFHTAQQMMVYGIWLNLILCFFNLIPVPPLDGSHLLYHALPPRAGAWYRGLNRFGYLPIFVLIFLFRPVMLILLAPASLGMAYLMSIISPYSVGM
jgi:Zn-dependent protease